MTNFGSDVLIIGAGMSGLTAARILTDAGKRVVVVDKGRNVGGRLATRRIGEGQADHGAQFFTVRDSVFRTYVDRWIKDGLVFEWSRGWSDGSLVETRDGHPRYAVRGGMNALARVLAEGLDARPGVEISAVHRISDGWQAEDINGRHFTAKALIMTAPAPQTLALLDAGKVPLEGEDRAALEAIRFEPCVTGMFLIDGEASLPQPGAIQRPGAQIAWIADNKRKGIASKTLLTAQANPNYSRVLWDRRDDEIINSMRIDLMPFIGEKTRILEGEIKRWRYALPVQLHPEPTLIALNLPLLAFGGDAFGQPRMEGAFLSGWATGGAIRDLLG